jgi:hypothetical protein
LSSGQSDPEIAHIGACWTRTEQGSNLIEERVGIAAVEKIKGVEPPLLRGIPSGSVDPSTRRIGGTVFAVGSCTEERAASQQIDAAKFE